MTQRQRSAERETWLNANQPPEKRLDAFHRWLSGMIAWLLRKHALDAKTIGAIRGLVLRNVRQLNAAGYLFDGTALADLIEAKLKTVADAVARKQIPQPYGYIKVALSNWIAMEKENLRTRAMQGGFHIDSLMTKYRPSIPELETQRHEEALTDRLRRTRAAEARKSTEADQQQLF